MRAIQTIYAGDCFKSRLEARWAMFFRCLGIEYIYEKESFGLLSGWYVPDFWLCKERIWIEVKPRFSDRLDTMRYVELARSTGNPLVCLMGKPEKGKYDVLVFTPSGRGQLDRGILAESVRREGGLVLVKGGYGWEFCNNSRIYRLPSNQVDAANSRIEQAESRVKAAFDGS